MNGQSLHRHTRYTPLLTHSDIRFDHLVLPFGLSAFLMQHVVYWQHNIGVNEQWP